MVVEEKARGIAIMDSAANNSRKNENRDVEGINDGARAQASITSERKAGHQKVNSSSSSTSSGSSSEDGFFQLSATALTKPATGEATERSNAQLEKQLDATNSSPADDKPGNRAILAAGSDARDRDSSGRLVGLDQTPIQESGRIDGYDPNRIPASVFARPKSTAPGDWSTASNESLFSIQMGNSSFSRDHVFLIGRSGDPGDLSYSPPPGAAPSAVPPTFHSGEMSLGRSGRSGRAASTEQTNAEAMKDVMKAVAEEHANARVVPAEGTLHSSGSSRRSDASSIQSFAFPILPGGIGSLKVVPEQQTKKQEPENKEAAELHSPKGPPKPPPPHSKWLLCFSCSFCRTD